MKVLVTGANGFLGRHVVSELLKRGHVVRALVRPSTRLDALGWPGTVEVVRGDLRVSKDLVSAFEDVDVLVHLAAAVTGGDDAQFATGVVGTEKLLDAMSRSGTKRIVLASSFSVYDWVKTRGTLDENAPLEVAPGLYERDGYAVAKVWQERVTRRFAENQGWGLTVLRPGFIWGEGNEELACLGQKLGPIYLAIGPMTRIPLTHVENCAACFATAVENLEAVGGTFNVVDDEDVRVWQYLGDYLRRSGVGGWRVPVPYVMMKAFVQLAHATSKWIFRGKGKLPSLLVPRRFTARFKPLSFRNQKARERLGWRPGLSYQEGLRRTYEATEGPFPGGEVRDRDRGLDLRREPVAAHDS
jgi:nucleoside-diphosphate-sugar epimerase